MEADPKVALVRSPPYCTPFFGASEGQAYSTIAKVGLGLCYGSSPI